MFALERGVTHYTSNYGYLELRKALAKYVGKKFGAEYNPEDEILITVGVSEALDLALRALVLPRRRRALPRAVLRVVSRHDFVRARCAGGRRNQT